MVEPAVIAGAAAAEVTAAAAEVTALAGAAMEVTAVAAATGAGAAVEVARAPTAEGTTVEWRAGTTGQQEAGTPVAGAEEARPAAGRAKLAAAKVGLEVVKERPAAGRARHALGRRKRANKSVQPRIAI